jgi:hypothetical protein
LPANLSFSTTANSFIWASIFYGNSTTDIVTYIPLADNRLRGVVTQLTAYFGYDFYSTSSGSSESSARYLLERQIDASPSYLALSDAQGYYYTVGSQTDGVPSVHEAPMGDLRRYVTMNQVTKSDSTFAVMIKFSSANVPLYRTATVYLRLAEAMNRMGYPRAAFAILKDGISPDMLTERPAYIDDATMQMLQTTVPFLSAENREKFANNWGIHSRGCYYTRGAFSPYQMDTIVGRKLAEIDAQMALPAGLRTLADTINAVEDLLCDEMALELAFEGTRFGDLTRLARHKNHDNPYRENFGSEWLAAKLAYKQPVKDLTQEANWFLPLR